MSCRVVAVMMTMMMMLLLMMTMLLIGEGPTPTTTVLSRLVHHHDDSDRETKRDVGHFWRGGRERVRRGDSFFPFLLSRAEGPRYRECLQVASLPE